VITEQQARQTIPRVIRALVQAYGEPPELDEGDALDMSLRTILHEYSSERAASAGMRGLQEEFVDWNELRVSTPHQLARAIDLGENSETAAEVVLDLLRAVFGERNEMSLEFLREASASDARSFLDGIPKLGPILTAKILLLVIGQPSIVATTDVSRVCLRLEWIREDYDVTQTQRRLERLVTKSLMPALYHAFREHGRKTCLTHTPRCKSCPILRHCPFGREATKRKKPASPAKATKKKVSSSRKK